MGQDHLPSQCINLPGTSLEFVPTASWDDAPLGRNNIIKAGPKQELKKEAYFASEHIRKVGHTFFPD
jgi:hypothetical protein